ncbi:MAG: ABC transporter permease [Alphaproteobacteria bacterium]|nr:ABC transporter permease [Alphaproteobacteria bacterium]
MKPAAAQGRRPIVALAVIAGAGAGAILAAALLNIFGYSVRAYTPGSLQVGGFTLANFVRMVSAAHLAVLWDTIFLGFVSAVLSLLLSFPLAYAMVRATRNWVKALLFLVAIMPLFTGDVTRTYAWTVVLGDHGFLNVALMAAGLIEHPLSLLYTRAGVVIVLVQYPIPVMTMIIAAGLRHVGTEHERAAATLGATSFQIMTRIVLPLALPGITSALILVFAWNLSAFATPQLIGGGRVPMIANLVYQEGVLSFDLPLAASLSLLALALTLVLVEVSRLCLRRLGERAPA